MTNWINEKRVRAVRTSTRTLAFCAIPHGSGEQPYAVMLRHVPNTPDRAYVVYYFHMESGAFAGGEYMPTLEHGYIAFAARVAKCASLYADRVDDGQKWVTIKHGYALAHPFFNVRDEQRSARNTEEDHDHDA